MTDSEKFLKDIFLREISNIDQNIGRYDTHSLIIKGWAITLWSALTFFAIQYSIYLLFLIQIPLLFIFWSFDALYKFYQRRFVIRSEKILNFLRDYGITKKDNELVIGNKKQDGRFEKDTLNLVIQREEHLIEISKEDDKKLKSIGRCFIIRVVSVFYLFLIITSFFIPPFILIEFCLSIRITVIILNIIALIITIFHYIYGYDNAISGYFGSTSNDVEKTDLKKKNVDESYIQF
ncbi:MAG: hypothetical protein GF311_18830 [Candidatus Lokiarchaeota archaeon]|nr:hypothetical protein [Candidatus Lokiarchaeota archaeon]